MRAHLQAASAFVTTLTGQAHQTQRWATHMHNKHKLSHDVVDALEAFRDVFYSELPFPPAPDSDHGLRFRASCPLMGLLSLERYERKGEGQIATHKCDEAILGAISPASHENNGQKFSHRHEIATYNAAKKSHG